MGIALCTDVKKDLVHGCPCRVHRALLIYQEIYIISGLVEKLPGIYLEQGLVLCLPGFMMFDF